MKNLTLASLISLMAGLLGHAIFYPIITSWRNDRMRDLSRPAIGVLLNAVPFLAWMRAMRLENEEEAVTKGLAAYILSFVWNAAGVVGGYMIGDVIKVMRNKA